MYIEPNSTIKLITQCPLDASYENTLWFESYSDQTNYFLNTLYGYTFTKQSYQRVRKGVIRIAKQAEEMYDCNYLMFRNVSFGSKWFYAFIDKIEYVNNVTSEITYTIDVLQTWHFDYSMEQCFVEREHSVTDEIGDNIVDEQLDTGEYISEGIDYYPSSQLQDPYQLIIWATFDYNYDNVGGYHEITGGNELFSGLWPNSFPLTHQGISDAISWMGDIPAIKLQGIVTIQILPYNAGSPTLTLTYNKKETNLERTTGYVKNKKLYTYPYNFLYVTNNHGKSANYRYEFFSTSDCRFSIFCDINPNATELLIPKYYKGAGENYDELLELNGFPQCAYNVDSYKAWLAQNASSIVLSSLGGAAGLASLPSNFPGMPVTETALAPYSATTAATGAALGSISSVFSTVAIIAAIRTELQGIIHSMMPPQAKGNQANMTLVALDKMKYGFMRKHITKEYATIIDDYFTMYGYATKKVKYPNRSSRPEWNYVKTIGCKIRGGVPNDDATAIEALYDRGVRFWKNPAHIGNYTFDNSPVVQNNPNIPSE